MYEIRRQFYFVGAEMFGADRKLTSQNNLLTP